MGKLFGTDGIRGKANFYPINCELALKTGQATGEFAKQNGFKNIIIGKDTRLSGDMLESALAAGIASTGVDVKLAGVIPTPGVSFLCADDPQAGAAIVVSASHNPFEDNGIKIFKNNGEKLSDKEEAQIENLILNSDITPSDTIGVITKITDGLERYADFLLNTFPDEKLKTRFKLIIDCSNGAASQIAPMVFNEKLFDVQFIHNTPDGRNINFNCGSQHVEDLKGRVIKEKADVGLAFDGDADRLIVVDEQGRQVTGDSILAVCASYAKNENLLPLNKVVSTIMSNVGLTKALKEEGIDHLKSDVGDRKVLQVMKQEGAVIGGEDSGHMIFLNYHTTGDGMLTALRFLEVMAATQTRVSQLVSIMTVFPQVLMNVEVDDSRPDFMKIKGVASTIEQVEKQLGSAGRVLIRYSGTQPLLRVMVEGEDLQEVTHFCTDICQSIKKHMPGM